MKQLDFSMCFKLAAICAAMLLWLPLHSYSGGLHPEDGDRVMEAYELTKEHPGDQAAVLTNNSEHQSRGQNQPVANQEPALKKHQYFGEWLRDKIVESWFREEDPKIVQQKIRQAPGSDI